MAPARARCTPFVPDARAYIEHYKRNSKIAGEGKRKRNGHAAPPLSAANTGRYQQSGHGLTFMQVLRGALPLLERTGELMKSHSGPPRLIPETLMPSPFGILDAVGSFTQAMTEKALGKKYSKTSMAEAMKEMQRDGAAKREAAAAAAAAAAKTDNHLKTKKKRNKVFTIKPPSKN